MAKRISVSLSESLFDDLNLFKDKFSISKVCQKALRKSIEIEKMKQDFGDIDKLAERIRKERNEYGSIYKNEGFKDGVRDTYLMSFAEMAFYDIYYRDAGFEEVFKALSSNDTKIKYEALLNGDFEYIDSSNYSKEKLEEIHSSGKITVDIKGVITSTGVGLDIEEFLGFSDFEEMYLEGFIEGIEHIIRLVRERGAF